MKLELFSFRLIQWILIILVFFSCVEDSDYESLALNCEHQLTPNISIGELLNLYEGETFQIQEDLIIEGYVISSTAAGNFFSSLHFQDKAKKPTEGLQIEIDLNDSHLFFEEGQHIYIKLKELYLGRSKGVFKIGGVFSSFGNKSVGRLPRAVLFDHIFNYCSTRFELIPTTSSIDELDDSLINTLIKLEDVQFAKAEVGKAYADYKKETKRVLLDCNGNEITLLNSGYSDFYQEPIPNKRGEIIGLLSKERNNYQLVIRDLDDIRFYLERCN